MNGMLYKKIQTHDTDAGNFENLKYILKDFK